MFAARIIGLFILYAAPLAAQDAYQVRLMPASATFYCGIVNAAIVQIQDLSVQGRKFLPQAKASGAQIDYDRSGKFFILPKENSFTIDVYAEMAPVFHYVGKLRGTCVQPPSNDATFNAVFPNPRGRLAQVRNFQPNGKTVLEDSLLIAEYGGGMAELTAGKDNFISMRLFSHSEPVPWWQCDIRSNEADVVRDHKQIFNIRPAQGRHRCTLFIYYNGRKVAEESIGVR